MDAPGVEPLVQHSTRRNELLFHLVEQADERGRLPIGVVKLGSESTSRAAMLVAEIIQRVQRTG